MPTRGFKPILEIKNDPSEDELLFMAELTGLIPRMRQMRHNNGISTSRQELGIGNVNIFKVFASHAVVLVVE